MVPERVISWSPVFCENGAPSGDVEAVSKREVVESAQGRESDRQVAETCRVLFP